MPQVYIKRNFQIWPKTKLSSVQSMVPPPLIFVNLCCNFLWQIWLHICEEVWWSDSMKCMHMISSDRGHSEGWGSTAVWDLSESYNVIAKDCHQMTGNSLRSAWEIFDQVHREWTWRCQMGIHVGCATARYQNHKSYVCPQITRWCNWKWWNKSIFLAVQDSSISDIVCLSLGRSVGA